MAFSNPASGENPDSIEPCSTAPQISEQLQVNIVQEQPQKVTFEQMRVEETKPRSRPRLLAIVVGLYVS